jgi:hypothetical protein
MVCSIADNTPLKQLQLDLGLPSQCHSVRPHCIQGYESRTGNHVLGLPGTALGYCQALFNYAGDPATHTLKVLELLTAIGAPWAKSHELFWGHRKLEHPNEFVYQALKPLLGTGRVPILITGLDPARQQDEIQKILATSPAVQPGETILVRMVLGGTESLYDVAALIKKLLSECRENTRMPTWWPLLQGDLDIEHWSTLWNLLDADWKYVNVAVNPFTSQEVFNLVREQITVAQVPIGLAEGISSEGEIQIAPGMRIMGATEQSSYSLSKFAESLSSLSSLPTIIILGPSLPSWSDEVNQARLAKLLPILRSICDSLWSDLPKSRREAIWNMRA